MVKGLEFANGTRIYWSWTGKIPVPLPFIETGLEFPGLGLINSSPVSMNGKGTGICFTKRRDWDFQSNIETGPGISWSWTGRCMHHFPYQLSTIIQYCIIINDFKSQNLMGGF